MGEGFFISSATQEGDASTGTRSCVAFFYSFHAESMSFNLVYLTIFEEFHIV